ncbi:unnamed protein product [Heligmosomoides polygyrus]|uniref:Endo/exonuclease/phosphatase domain-containing protein n=1 Tax=Heligmosomoides polygyrus TaxID=6339 RepID=A0A183GCV3_HELPZ|nr:unnamed protein product [Heligmosomoides polygyrus]
MTICTYNVRTLASEASDEDLMMQPMKMKYDVIGLTEMRRHHSLHAPYDTGEELFLEACDSREGNLPVFVAYAPTSDYDDEEVEAFYVELEKFYKEDHTFYKVIVDDFNAKIEPKGRRKNFTSELTVWSGTSKVKGCLSWKPTAPEVSLPTMDLEILRWQVPQRDRPHHPQPQILPDQRLRCLQVLHEMGPPPPSDYPLFASRREGREV